MEKPEIKAYIQELKAEATKDFKEELNQILIDIHNEAMADYSEAYDMQGDSITLKNLKEIPLHVRKCIEKFRTSVNENGSGMLVDASFSSKRYAREQVFKYHGVYAPEKREVSVKTIDELILGDDHEA